MATKKPIPESQRNTKAVKLRLDPAVERMLRAQAEEAGWESISLYVAELVREAERRRKS